MKRTLLMLAGLVMVWQHVGAQGIVDTTFNSYLPPASIDLDGDGQDDFSVNWCGYFIGTEDVPQSLAMTYWTLAVLSGGSIGMGDGGGVAAGTVIDASSGFWAAPGTGAMLASLLEYPLQNRVDWTGVLAPAASGLVAVSFTAQDGFTHYGWIRFRQANSPANVANGVFIEFGPQIAEFAWNTVPNQAIKAGQTDEPVYFEATFNGGNEVPPNQSRGSGTGTFVLVGNTLSCNLTLAGSFLLTSVGIYGPANPNINSSHLIADLSSGLILYPPPPSFPPIVLFTTDNKPTPIISQPPSILVFSNQVTLSSNQVTELLAGQLYVNFKSVKFRQGELRGEIFPTTPIPFSATLSSRNEIPRNPRNISTLRGEAAFTLTGNNLSCEVAMDVNFAWTGIGIYTSPLTTPFSLIAKLDTTYGVMIPAGGLPNAPGLPGQVLYADNLTLTDEQVYRLKHGDFYINVLTSRFRNGDIGGRIVPAE